MTCCRVLDDRGVCSLVASGCAWDASLLWQHSLCVYHQCWQAVMGTILLTITWLTQIGSYICITILCLNTNWILLFSIGQLKCLWTPNNICFCQKWPSWCPPTPAIGFHILHVWALLFHFLTVFEGVLMCQTDVFIYLFLWCPNTIDINIFHCSTFVTLSLHASTQICCDIPNMANVSKDKSMHMKRHSSDL